MDGALEFTSRSSGGSQATSTAKSRRSLPPELVHAVDLERLYWSLHIKGLDKGTVVAVPRARHLGVRFVSPAANPAIGINAALREIERLRPLPALIPANSAARRRGGSLERWFCNEIAPCVMWWLQSPVPSSAIRSLIIRGLDLIAGLTDRHPYVLGDALSAADITAAAVLAPIARSEGWAWAGRTSTPILPRPGHASLAAHSGAKWVRHFYEQHGAAQTSARPAARAWLP